MGSDSEHINASPELKKLHALLRKENALDELTIVPVADAGYILQTRRFPPHARDWVLFDYDDTVVAYSKSKEARLIKYQEYLMEQMRSHNINTTDVGTIAVRLMKITDSFARWPEAKTEGSKDNKYHAGAHMTALSWATNFLTDPDTGAQNGADSINDRIDRIRTVLEGVHKNDENTDVRKNADYPFYMNQNGQLVNKSISPWAHEIEAVFHNTMFDPESYTEPIEAMREIGFATDPDEHFNIGIFTYGDPVFQLSKILQLMKKDPDLPISQIWLTKEAKGDFVRELVSSGAAQQAQLSTQGGDSDIAYQPFGADSHTFIMIEDDPNQIKGIHEANVYLIDTGARFACVRSIRDGTKTAKHPTEQPKTHEVIDYTNGKRPELSIALIVRIHRYLRMPEGDPRKQTEANFLSDRGINIAAL